MNYDNCRRSLKDKVDIIQLSDRLGAVGNMPL